ncbi:MAG: choice-of-anchor J domain-containing protein, partial [Candidatus Cloacimonetes bacterium]|nr:choice-of-anchor J domain-containing protein [Candidatus Cloacimonadota bacterium]
MLGQNQWMEIPLDTSFNYDNTSNLIVAIHEYTGGFGRKITWRSFTSGANTGIFDYSGNTVIDPQNPPSARITSTLSQIQLVFPTTTSVPLAPTLIYPTNEEEVSTIIPLQWLFTNGSSDPESYDLYFDTDPNPSLWASNITETTYTMQLQVNTTYYWKVVAKNAFGYSPASPVNSFNTFHPEVVQIGDSNTGQRYPFSTDQGYKRSATLYSSTEIGAYGNINALSWNCMSTGSSDITMPYKIYLKQITDNSITALPWTGMIAGAQLVKEGTHCFNTGGWHNFNLDVPFLYTGDNLLVLVETNYGGTGVSEGPFFRATLAAYITHLCYSGDNTPPTTNGTFNDYRPIIMMHISEIIGDPGFTINSNSYDFGDVRVGSTKSQNFTITNIGGGDLIINSITVSGNPDFTLSNLPNLPATMATIENTSFMVNFAPTALGLASATITITDNIGGRSTHTVQVLGNGTEFLIIGDGSSNQYMPVNAYYGYTYSQSIYLQSEISTPEQRIEKIAYYWNGAGVGNYSNEWVIYMGHTDDSVFASTTGWIPLSQLTPVYAGTLNIPAVAGWIEIELHTPFVYNNSQNLVIAVDENRSSYDGSSQFFYCTPTGNQNRSLRYYNDSTNPDPASPPTGSLVAAYPNIRLQFGSTAPYSISGRVVRNAIPAIGIADATVSLMGNETHNGITDANGFFSFTGLEGEQDYTWEISHAGYISKYGSLNNINVDYDMGEIALDTILPYFDMGLVNSYLPNDQTYQGKLNAPMGITGDRSFNVYYNQNGPYPTVVPKYHVIDENLGSSTPVNLFAQAPNNITNPKIHSDGNTIYIAGLYSSSGRDPVHYEKYDIATGTMTYVGSQSSWPTGAFSDIGLRAMLKSANGRIYMLSCWHYNGWENDPADIYLRYSTNEMASWSNWIQGAHIDGEGLVYDSYMMEGSDGFIHLILWTNWGNQNKIAYFKFDQSTDSFVQRSILGLGKNPALYIDETTGRMAALYLNSQGKVICRYSDLADTQNWTDEEIVLENAGGIYGTGNSNVNGPYDLGHHYYLWNSTSSRQLLQWNGIDSWAKHEELPTTYLGKEYESARIYRSESGKLQIMQGYKDSGIAQYYNHLEIVSAEDAAYPYPSVSGLLATCGGMEVHLSWQASGNPQSFKIYRDKALIGESNTSGFADYNVTAMERYNYYVCAVYADGISKPSETINVLIPVLPEVSDYSFSSSVGTYTEISGGTVLLNAPPSPLNPVFNEIELGFDFGYNGVTYTTVSIAENGFLAMGNQVVTSNLPLSQANGTNNVVAALARDIRPRDEDSELSYITQGTAPNRVFIAQWKNFRRNATATANDVLNFQIQLHEGTNKIVFSYGSFSAVTALTAATVQVGLRGASNADFNNRTTTEDWAATTAGSAANNNCTLSATVYPAEGLTFSFSPVQQGATPNPAQNPLPVHTALNVNTHTLLSWSSGGGAPTGYKVYLGTNTPPTNLVNGTTQTGTNYQPDTALNYNTQYYWKIVPFNDDGDAENCPVWTFTTWADPTVSSYPYIQDFDEAIPPALPYGWSTINANGDNYTWESIVDIAAHTAPNVMRIRYNSNMAMDDWLISPPLQVVGGHIYEVSFYYRANSTTYPEKLALYKGSAPTAAAMTEQLWVNSNITNTTYRRAEILVPMEGDGTIYLGFHGHSEEEQFYLYIDSFEVMEMAVSLDPPTNLAATVDGMDVHLSWTAPGGGDTPPGDGFADDFESYQDFALEFEPWVLVDVDQSATYGFSGYSWPNVYSAMAYMVFNPSATTPPLTSIDAHSGSKMAACFASTQAVNNDWMMSPQVSVNAGESLSFWARSYTTEYGMERFKVGVSTGGTAPADFTIISGASYIQAPAAWTQYSYDLSAYAGQDIRIGINCVSDNAFFFLVDDVSIGSAPARFAFNPVTNYPSVSPTRSTGIAVPAPKALTRNLLGYKVYRDGDLISTINSGATTTYDDLDLVAGTYSYTVTAFYNSGESEPAGPVIATILHLPAPQNLAATVDGNDVILDWDDPGSTPAGDWITWCNPDAIGNGIGTGSATQFDVAHMFDAADLAQYQGSSISQIKFVPRYQNCVYTVKVWTGGSASTPGNLVYSAVHNGFTIGDWNLHTLSTPVPIPADRLWIGYHVNTQGGNPAGCDGGPVIEGKGNIMNFGGWTTLAALAPSLTYNWSIQGFVSGANATRNVALKPILETPNPIPNGTLALARFEPKRNSRALLGYKVYRDAAQIAEINDPNITTYTDLDLPYGTYLYGVSSLYSNGESETATINVVLSPAEPPQNVQVVEIYPASLISWEAPASRSLQNYQVWRLMAGNEDMEESWTFIGTAGETQYYFWDQDWHLLEAGAYRYAVKALYDNNQSSLPGFSNILTKSAQTLVYGSVLDSYTNAAINGARIAVQGYEAFSDATGNYQLDLAPGTYQLTCFKDGYRVKYQHSITVGASQGLALNLVLDENLLMPNSLSVSANPNQPEAGVELSWNVPTAAGTSWINYDKEATGRSIGTNSQADLDVAIRFPAAMLAQYAGSSLRSVRVLPNAEGEFSIRVWTGGNATAPGIMVVDQPFTPLIGAYNTIELENPVYIQGNEELWIGYRCNVPGDRKST